MNMPVDLMQKTGLELLQAMLQGELPPPTMAETMGLSLVHAEEGRAVFHARPRGSHLNALGTVHGGFAATVLDSVTGCAVHTLLPAGAGYGTVDLNVKMLRPVPTDKGDLVAEGRVIHLSGRLGVAEGTLKDADGVLYAHGTATCMIRR